jgi:microcystin degradation protein MlrC
VSLRIGIASFCHRTNTFAAGRTELDDFRACVLAEGANAVVQAHAEAATAVGGALSACAAIGYEAVPLLAAEAVPGPPLSADARRHLHRRLLELLEQAGALDGLVIVLGGSAVAEDSEDPEVELLSAVRARTGSIPIAALLDLQANPADALLQEADIVLAGDTYPRSDGRERGAEAVGLLATTLEGTLAPLAAGRRLPLLTCPLGQATAEEPMASLLALARRLQARPGVARVSLLPGFPYADVERLGFAVAVTGEAGPANEAADELAAAVWDRRATFERPLATVEEALRLAAGLRGPVVLAEVADSIGCGAPGNGTQALRALLDLQVEGAAAVLHDAAATAAAAQAGAGEIELRVGDPPLTLRGEVARADPRGRWAVIRAGGVEITLAARRLLPDADGLRAMGIEPASRRLLLLKSAVGWRAGLGELATAAFALDTAGPATCRLGSLAYRRAPRPLCPLDPT